MGFNVCIIHHGIRLFFCKGISRISIRVLDNLLKKNDLFPTTVLLSTKQHHAEAEHGLLDFWIQWVAQWIRCAQQRYNPYDQIKVFRCMMAMPMIIIVASVS